MTTYIIDASNGFGLDILNGDGDLIPGQEMLEPEQVVDFIMSTEGGVEFYIDGVTGIDGSVSRDVDETIDLIESLPE